MFIALQAIFSLFLFSKNFEKLKRLLIPYLINGICYLPWLPNLLYQLNHNQDRIAWISAPELTAFGKFWIFAFEDNIYFAGFVAFVILAYFIGEYKDRKILSIFKIRGEEKYPFVQDVLLLYWIVLPQLIIYVISITTKPLFVHRYFLFLLPAIYLLLARAITTVKMDTIPKYFIGLLIVLFFLFDLLFSKDYYSRKTKEPFRDVANHIVNTNIENTLLVSNALPISLDYYFEKLNSSLRTDLRINPPKSDTNLALLNQVIKDLGSKNYSISNKFLVDTGIRDWKTSWKCQ